MTSTASPVTTATGLSVPGSSFGIPQANTLYTVQSVVPERIEAVYMVATFPSNMATHDIFTLQLCDQPGNVLYEQATPPLLGVDGAQLIAYLTWSRLGNDTPQLPASETLFSVGNFRRTWLNMRLPDLVLATGAFINLVGWFEDGAEVAPVLVDNISVTVTRNAGAVSSTVPLSVFPLLTPTDEG